jgi:uncharacterized protein
MQFEQAGEYILNKLRNHLPRHLTYHNIDHTVDVYAAAEHIGLQENITAYEMNILLTAALFHDAGYIKRVQGHEEESCRMASAVLPGFGYTEADIELICAVIMATRLPQTPVNQLGMILADADLDYLGRDDFFIIGQKLSKELYILDAITNETEWNLSQLEFMKNHRYFTQTAIKLRREKKLENIEQIKAQLTKEKP